MNLREIDSLLFFYINKGLQNHVFDLSMPFITDKYYFFILAIAGWIVIRDRKNAVIPILLAVISIALSDWISHILKHIIERPRPCHVLEGVRLLVGCGGSFSMPSNHAANASSIILSLSYQSIADPTGRKKLLRWLILAIAVLVGFSRIYVGVHYPSDVIVGAFVGITVSLVVISVYRWSVLRYEVKPYNTVLMVSLLSLSLFRIYYITQGIIDLSPDEAHYWEWSRRLDLSYYSKGPMIAYLIAIGTAIFGENIFGIRIVAVIFFMLSSIFMYLLGKRLFDERTGTATAILMQIVPLYSTYGVIFTIDSPFIFFWISSLYLFYRAIEQINMMQDTRYKIHPLQSPLDKGGIKGGYHESCIMNHASPMKYWLLLGLSIGLGLLTKYTMAFFYLCAFFFLLFSRQSRKLLLTKWPYISLALSLIVFSPVIIWNISHDWVTLKHTAGQAHLNDHWSAISSQWSKNLFDFLGSQIGIITPIIFAFILYSLFKLKNNPPPPPFSKGGKGGLPNESNGGFLFWFSMPILLFFLLKSLHGKVQANWALAGYATGFIAFSGLFIGRWESMKKWLRWVIILGVILSFGITAIAHYTAILKLPLKLDPTARIKGWKELGEEVSRVSNELSKKGPLFIFSDRYQVSSELAFYVRGHPVTYCINLGRRMNQYDLWPGFNYLLQRNAIFVTIGDTHMPDVLVTGFDGCDKKIFTVYSRGRSLRDYSIFTCYNFKGIQQKGAITY